MKHRTCFTKYVDNTRPAQNNKGNRAFGRSCQTARLNLHVGQRGSRDGQGVVHAREDLETNFEVVTVYPYPGIWINSL